MEAYPRELGTVIDRAAILGDGKRLEVATALGVGGPAALPQADRPRTLMAPWSGVASASSANESAGQGAASTHRGDWSSTNATGVCSLDDAIRRHIESALRIAQGQIEGRRGAAAMLQINPHTLRAKMRKLGIDWSAFRQDEP